MIGARWRRVGKQCSRWEIIWLLFCFCFFRIFWLLNLNLKSYLHLNLILIAKKINWNVIHMYHREVKFISIKLYIFLNNYILIKICYSQKDQKICVCSFLAYIKRSTIYSALSDMFWWLSLHFSHNIFLNVTFQKKRF